MFMLIFIPLFRIQKILIKYISSVMEGFSDQMISETPIMIAITVMSPHSFISVLFQARILLSCLGASRIIIPRIIWVIITGIRLLAETVHTTQSDRKSVV